MGEQIHYGKGRSSLGDFLAAVSDQGLVAFEFTQSMDRAIEALRTRFADADVIEDVSGLASIIAALSQQVDDPKRDPGLPLDLRGTEQEMKVWEVLRSIPAGSTTTHSAVAAKTGSPRDAREATAAIAANTIAILVPCHRVIKKDGTLSGYRWGQIRKRALLARERLGGLPSGDEDPPHAPLLGVGVDRCDLPRSETSIS